MLQRVSYYLALPFIYLVAYLPFPLLYALSDFLFVVLYYGLGYRKKVVYTNLKNAFPEMDEATRQRKMRAFYRYLCDLLLETLKTLTMTKATVRKRCAFEDASILQELAAKQQSAILVMGHYGNWEWAGAACSTVLPQPLYVIYHPLSNPYFDRLIYKMRTRLGTRLIPRRETLRQMIAQKEEVNLTAFIADQTPSPKGAYWMPFLNQDTPVFMGTEKIARKMQLPVVYVELCRPRRGYYRIRLHLLTHRPHNMEEGKLTELHTRILEETILREPAYWLWSHRRWKHKRQ